MNTRERLQQIKGRRQEMNIYEATNIKRVIVRRMGNSGIR